MWGKAPQRFNVMGRGMIWEPANSPMAMATKRADPNASIATAKLDALSPRRLMALTGLFIAAFAAILVGFGQEDAAARRTETELRIALAADRCAATMNVAIVRGESLRRTLGACHPGGVAALYHFSAANDILTAFGDSRAAPIAAAFSATIDFTRSNEGLIDSPVGPLRAAWRPLDNGEAILAVAPRTRHFSAHAELDHLSACFCFRSPSSRLL